MAQPQEKKGDVTADEVPVLMVASSPHLHDSSTSRRVMFEVVLGLVPAVLASLYLFGALAGALLAACVLSAVITEWIFTSIRRKPRTIDDGAAIVTGLILGLSLPPTLPIWAAVVGSVVAVAVAKMLFGGLGSNIFNPAMVGRAFLMAAFGTLMTTWLVPEQVEKYLACGDCVAMTQPTPLALAKQAVKDAYNPDKPAPEKMTAEQVNDQVEFMFKGDTSGSLGETSALIWLIGGVFLLVRRTITYHIPLAVLGSATAIGTIAWLTDSQTYANPLVHLCGGGLMMCAFFIATDPVSCPLSKPGRVIFGIGVGALIMLIRLIGGYPEGVMYAVLLMNAMTPLLDRWTHPKPLGGHIYSC